MFGDVLEIVLSLVSSLCMAKVWNREHCLLPLISPNTHITHRGNLATEKEKKTLIHKANTAVVAYKALVRWATTRKNSRPILQWCFYNKRVCSIMNFTLPHFCTYEVLIIMNAISVLLFRKRKYHFHMDVNCRIVPGGRGILCLLGWL